MTSVNNLAVKSILYSLTNNFFKDISCSVLEIITWYFGQRDHPFKTSACLRGGGRSPLPMFADARGQGF